MHPGLAHVQRSEIPRDAIDVPQTVRQTLETMRDRLREQFPAAGMTVEQFSFAERDDGIEGCVERR